MKKNILYLIAASLCLLFLSGCDKFLDTQSYTKKNDGNFPVNETDAYQMVTGIYAMMNMNLADPEEDPFFVFDIASDDRLGGGSQSNIGAQGVDRLMNAYLSWMEPLWQCRYAGIYRANYALENIDRIEKWSNDTNKNQLLCEIYFFRAWYYFNLAQIFNGVPMPLKTEPENLPRSSADEVYAQIASDLKKSIEFGPSLRYPKFGDGHVSKWTAEGMMARVWLFYTGFYGKSELPLAEGGSISKAQVVTWLEDCINNSGYGLVSDQRNLWPYTNPYTAPDYPYAKDNKLEWVTDENIENMFAVKFVYLSYCHECKKGLIDSRETKQCPNGLYICPSCNSCCSNAFFNEMASRYRRQGLNPPAFISRNIGKGHKDLNMFFCPKCGAQKTEIVDKSGVHEYRCLVCHPIEDENSAAFESMEGLSPFVVSNEVLEIDPWA